MVKQKKKGEEILVKQDKDVSDLEKRNFIKKGLLGLGFGASVALLSKIPFASAVDYVKAGNVEMTNFFEFTKQSTRGNGTTEVDWKLGNKFEFTFGAQNETFNFIAPKKPCNLSLTIVQDRIGSRTITWPPIKWAGGTAPALSKEAGAIDIVSLYYDGTNYFGMASLGFAVPA